MSRAAGTTRVYAISKAIAHKKIGSAPLAALGLQSFCRPEHSREHSADGKRSVAFVKAVEIVRLRCFSALSRHLPRNFSSLAISASAPFMYAMAEGRSRELRAACAWERDWRARFMASRISPRITRP